VARAPEDAGEREPLNLADKKARDYLAQQMERHFFGSGADVAAGYVPPSRSSAARAAGARAKDAWQAIPRNRPRSSCTRSRACSRISFEDGKSFRLPYEFLRVHSPSAEVRGHGPGQEVLQTGKKEVDIARAEPVGSYAIQLCFLRRPRDRHLFLGPAVPASARSRNPCGGTTLPRWSRPGASREPGAAPFGERPKTK
jgi:DUF971 family protein